MGEKPKLHSPVSQGWHTYCHHLTILSGVQAALLPFPHATDKPLPSHPPFHDWSWTALQPPSTVSQAWHAYYWSLLTLVLQVATLKKKNKQTKEQTNPYSPMPRAWHPYLTHLCDWVDTLIVATFCFRLVIRAAVFLERKRKQEPRNSIKLGNFVFLTCTIS